MGRVLPGILLAGCWLGLILAGSSQVFFLVVLIAAAVALHEYFRMAAPHLTLFQKLLAGCAAFCPLLGSCSGEPMLVSAGLLLGILGIFAIAIVGYSGFSDIFRFLCVSAFGCLYIGFFMAHVVLIRHFSDGPFWLVILTAMVAGSDTGAYYAGRAFGNRKFFPKISPKKTLAGCVGGIGAGVLIAQILNGVFSLHAHPLTLLWVAVLLIALGMAGDLTESMIKRSVGVKDSGTVLSGHGGLLDRIDSLLLTGPVLFYLVYFGLLR